MTIGLVAVHYPKPEHAEEMLDRVRAAAKVLEGVEGCLEATCWQTADGTVVTIGKWGSEDDLKAGFAAIAGAAIDFEYDQRESRPREIYRLTSVY